MSSAVEVWRKHKNLNKYLNRKGKVLTWTKIYVAPEGFEHQVPYFVGIIELNPSTGAQGRREKLPLQIVDCSDEQIKTGMEVLTVIRRGEKVNAEEVIEYSIKAKPFDNTQGKPI